jgi:hypothetical protein
LHSVVNHMFADTLADHLGSAYREPAFSARQTLSQC